VQANAAAPTNPPPALTKVPKHDAPPFALAEEVPITTDWEVPKPEVSVQIETPPAPPPGPPKATPGFPMGGNILGFTAFLPPPPAPIATTSIQTVPVQQDQVPLAVKHCTTQVKLGAEGLLWIIPIPVKIILSF
jgi:hypothetical protein